MKILKHILPFLALLPLLLSAEDRLVSLYSRRMQAETTGRRDSLEIIDLAIADRYLAQGNFPLARKFLESSMMLAEEETVPERKMDLYRLDIIEGNFSRAESGLLSLYHFTQAPHVRSRSAMLLGLLKALSGDYDASRDYVKESFEIGGLWTDELGTALDELLKDAKNRKKVLTAKYLSAFLPGAGQIYAKNAKGAVGAIGIAAFWGGWFAYDLLQQDYFSAALVLLWPWQRYHRGNIQNAGYSVERYNALIEDAINRELFEFLSEKAYP